MNEVLCDVFVKEELYEKDIEFKIAREWYRDEIDTLLSLLGLEYTDL